ncbi:unnamed protein product [Ixodes hexagonus]
MEGARLPGFPTVWEPHGADPLVDLCARRCLSEPRLLSCLPPGLPSALGECLASCPRAPLGTLLKCVRLERLDLAGRQLEDADLAPVVQQPLRALEMAHCSGLSPRALPLLARLGPMLRCLSLPGDVLEGDSSEDPDLSPLASLTGLERLSLGGPQVGAAQLGPLLGHLPHLSQLDLSRCGDLGSLACLLPLAPTLASLVLFDVPRLHLARDALCTLTRLRHLDVSQSREKQGEYPQPSEWLLSVVSSLPLLASLDISGTNLAGTGVLTGATPVGQEGSQLTDIPGLQPRVGRPLDFLGLLNTAHEACYRHHIPAVRVAGDASEEQVLVAAQVYRDRPELLQKVLNDLFHVFRYEACSQPRLALDVVMAAMARHLPHKHIQIAGSASLFYIVKGEEKGHFNIGIRRKIIKALLDGMCCHKNDTTMLRNGCLTLIHFKIPQDVLFEYERLVDMLLHMVAQEEQDEFVQRIGIYLLNSLACQVDGLQKRLVGDKGAITIMLQLIETRLFRGSSDEVMEAAWSTMWNVTDETPINCQRFLDGGGMALFLQCLQAFTDKPELLRNMMGLLGNVAEVKELRPRLMKDDYLQVFSDLLDSTSDGIEVSYNAAGILAHLVSDGAEQWERYGIRAVRRDQVLARMGQAIERWALLAKRNINYRSFEPILRLLGVRHTPQAQHWAVWALANLTQVYPDKYCPLVQEEGGLVLLQELLDSDTPYQRIKDLARIIVDQCAR